MKRDIDIPNKEELLSFLEGCKNINTVYIFGSHGTKQKMNLEAEIEKMVEREVDIVSLNKCNILLKYRVISEGQKIFERDEIKTADFIEDVLKNYFDFGMKLKHFYEDFQEGMREEIH